MSTSQRLTLIGLYNYENQFGRDLFDKLSLPAGYDKTTFVNTLLLEHGEKCVLYTNPDFLRTAIGIWSGKWQLELERIYEALTAEYNPIYNYDRYEESADGRIKDYKSKRSEEAKSKNEGGEEISRQEKTNAEHKAIDAPEYQDKQSNDYDVTTKTITSATTEHEISADNSSSYSPDWKETSNGGETKQENDGTITHDIKGRTQDLQEVSKGAGEESQTSKTSTEGQQVAKADVTDKEHENNTHKAHLYGNIGVTTSAAMVSEAVKQRMELNLYDVATRLFANELLLYIY